MDSHKRRRLENKKKKQGDKGHITRGRYCKIYKIFPTKIVWLCGKTAKAESSKTSCNGEEQRKEGGKNGDTILKRT